MLLSIVVPVYQVEEYLYRCIDSLLDQGAFCDYEIILVDDGSVDESSAICDQYGLDSANIITIHKENGGLSSARNAGTQSVCGKYILFVDSDDYVRSNSLARLVHTAEDNDADVVCFNHSYITEPYGAEENRELVKFGDQILTGEEYLGLWRGQKSIPMSACFKLYLTDIITGNRIYFREGYVHEDEEWSPRILRKAKRVAWHDECIYGYCIRSGSISNDDNKKASLDLLENCKSLKLNYQQIEDLSVRMLLENNTITLALSAFYKGRLFDKSDEIGNLICTLAATGSNTRKRQLFLFSPYVYYVVNTCVKTLKKIGMGARRGVGYLQKIGDYSNQEMRRLLRKQLICKKEKRRLTNHEFTIISSTCNGGVITSELGEQMRSPTVNLWMTASDYIKLIKDLPHYMSVDVVEVQNRFESYPVGKIDDLTLFFMHYHSFDEAKSAWNRRRKRINWNNLYFMMVEKDGCTSEMVSEFDALPFEHKVIFTKNCYPECPSAIQVMDQRYAPDAGVMTDFVGIYGRRYDKYLDYVAWLNGDTLYAR